MDEDEEYDLLCSIANSEGLHTGPKVAKYSPLFQHPLPLSERRHDFESSLKRILSCKIPFQGMAAITRRDAWSLEEVYMRHGDAVLGLKNGMSPIHLAVQMGQIECIMVLVNIGVDIDEPNSSGHTPLTIARSIRNEAVEKLLLMNNATEISSKQSDRLASTILDVVPERHNAGCGEVYEGVESKSVISPAKQYNAVMKSRHYY